MKLSVDDATVEFATPDGRGPVVLRLPVLEQGHAWLTKNRSAIDAIVGTHGGVLLRDFGFTSTSEFNRAVQIFSPDLLDYVHRSTPRTRVGGKLYTATEYPADRSIPPHNESAYSDNYPSRIYFFCLVAPERGGATPVVDSRAVYRRIDRDVRERFERLGVQYVRNFTAGVDLSWQEVFQTEDRSEVEKYCLAHEIEFQWRSDGPDLTTRQRRRATLRHPATGELVWFNQAHLFHLSALRTDEQASIVAMFGIDNVPRNAFYGDGSPIELAALEHIRDVYEQEKAAFPWQRGDLMMLDNLLFAHSREPYQGPRRIIVAMA